MAEYRIDDLAREAGTTTRNVRVYQENGLLTRPQRRGRVAIYTDRHLRQLQAVTRLLGEGFTVKHILKFLTGLQRGQELVEVLNLADLEELVTSPWSHPDSRTMSLAELQDRLGELDAAALRRLCANGVIEPAGDADSYLVPDRRIIEDYAALIACGMPLTEVLKASAAVDKKLDAAARTIAHHGYAEIVRQRGVGWYPSDDTELAWAAEIIAVMRRVAARSAHASLDRALETAVRNELRRYNEAATADSVPDLKAAAD
ncbi:MAG: MerR family transcriptional regulator [Mycolicibacterium sp.]|nr:MerR family transcriptional regulator [Mycolicibacterium sp.]